MRRPAADPGAYPRHHESMSETLTIAGRLAYESGRMPRKLYASASSPLGGSGGFVGS